jgi:hypothetical protein
MTRFLRTLSLGVTIAVGTAFASAVYAEHGQVPSPQSLSITPGMQHGDMMKMMPQMSQMMDGCIQMMKSHMQQPASPSPKPDLEQKD